MSDKEEAYKWYLKAANAGLGMGMFGMGRICTELRKSDDEVISWYQKAIDAGIQAAQSNLDTYLQEVRAGNLYHSTDYGVYNAEAIGI